MLEKGEHMFFSQAIERVQAAKTVAILAHISEDADAAGSSFAMAEMLRNMGKTAVCYFSDTLEGRLQFMGTDYVVYAGGEPPVYDLCISLDAGSIDRLGERADIFSRAGHTVAIDHHCTNTMFAEVNCVDGDISSTGELLYNLFQEMNVPLTQTAARHLYTAIASDTGCFKYSCTGPETMRAVAELMTFDISHADICRQLFDTNTLAVLRFKGWVMQNIQSFYQGRLRLINLGEADFRRFRVAEKDAGDIVNIPRCVDGTEIAVSIRRLQDKTKISFRSNGRYNVNELALRFGGGGHMMAAGATVDAGIDNIAEQVIAACGEILHD